jgi:DHA2 family multidrug resistance protein
MTKQLAGMSPVRHAMITVGVILGMLMQLLDLTIANVALPHMQVSLGATRDEIDWVLTSYIVAAAIATPITGWLTDRSGRKPLFLASIIAFVAASALCAVGQTIGQMVLFRTVQGIAGAFLVPLAQSTLLDINPPASRGRAMALFGAGVMIGPILGPMLGGWLTQEYDWRWVFLINVPVGAIAALLTWYAMPDTARLKRRFDVSGFALLAIGLASLQLVLDRGSQLHWLASWQIGVGIAVAVAGLAMFVVHILKARRPLFDPRMFRDRNFTGGLIFMGVSGMMLFAGLSLLPPLLQDLLGYSTLDTGVLMAPRGAGTLMTMLLVGRLVGRVDTRILAGLGVGLLACASYEMSLFTLNMGRAPVIVSGVVQGVGLGLIFVPVNTVAFATLDARQRTAGTSLFNLARNIGGSTGISIMATLLTRNIQLGDAGLMTSPGRHATLLMHRQAAMAAYIDDFRLMMVLTLCTLPLLLLLHPSRAARVRQANDKLPNRHPVHGGPLGSHP